MLYPTQLPSISPSLQDMECVEAALKKSNKAETPLKLSSQALFDDSWALNGSSSDDVFVDGLLDFSNEEGLVEKQEEDEIDKVYLSTSDPKKENLEEQRTDNYCFGSITATGSEISVPADDMENLEWLSHFVDDSFSVPLPSYPVVILPEKPTILVSNEKQGNPETKPHVFDRNTCFKAPVMAKSRSKRTRAGVRVWSLGSPSSPNVSSPASSPSSSSSSCPSTSSPWITYYNPGGLNYEPLEPVYAKPYEKKQRKKPAGDGTSHQPRRCSHCGVQKTPQWRTGPLGAKTLCNACGVRYKSGRLLPEYRPACSPTFSSELHSNHHRKVLEMRKTKEDPVQMESGLAVPSF